MAGLMVFFIMFLEGGNDILGVLLNLSVEVITRDLQWALLIAPVVTWLVTFWVCRSLKRSQVHPARINAGLRLRRTASGGYETTPLEPTSNPD
jgi:hypothetical protein